VAGHRQLQRATESHPVNRGDNGFVARVEGMYDLSEVGGRAARVAEFVDVGTGAELPPFSGHDQDLNADVVSDHSEGVEERLPNRLIESVYGRVLEREQSNAIALLEPNDRRHGDRRSGIEYPQRTPSMGMGNSVHRTRAQLQFA
jgi:hypothetical protein